MAIFTGFELFDLRDVSNGQIQSSAINLGSTGSWMIPSEVITAANNSGELLSGHIMYARARNGRVPTLNISEGSVNFSQVYTVGHTNILFPITRVLNPNSVRVTCRCAGTNDGYWGGAVELGKVVNGEFVKYGTSAYANKPSYNTDIDLVLDNLSSFEYIDYIVISCSNSSWTFKNIEIDGTVILPITSNGGGATHIAKRTEQLKDLSSYTSDILIVSGGGGGGLLVDTTEYTGKEAGGISGSGDNSADQTTGNAFGQGESGTNASGGGSGLYGGYKGTSSKSGGAGSGYIGNSLLSNKKMVGYNVPTSSAEGTKTESVNDVSASAVSGKPKSGNGFARIKFLREVIPDEDGWYSFETYIGTWTNGKSVYQIAIPNIDKTLARRWDILADVSSLNIDEIIKIDLLGIANSSFEGSLVAIHGAQVGLLNNNIVGYANNTNITPYAQTIKLRYTKTTDN